MNKFIPARRPKTTIRGAILEYFVRLKQRGNTPFSAADLAAYVRAVRGATCSPESVNRELRKCRQSRAINYEVLGDGRRRTYRAA